MALLDSFLTIFGAKTDTERDVNRELQALYLGFLQRADQLEATAAQGPTESSETELRRLASDHRDAAALIKTALETRNASVPNDVPVIVPTVGTSHWARTVEDLEQLQQGRDEMRDLGIEILESYPELTPLFDTLTESVNEHVARLRGQIARADPQALN